MNAVDALSEGGLVDHAFCCRLTLTLIHFIWQGAAIAAISFAAEYALRKRSANLRYGLQATLLALMVACLPATYLWLDVPAMEVVHTPQSAPSSANDSPSPRSAVDSLTEFIGTNPALAPPFSPGTDSLVEAAPTSEPTAIRGGPETTPATTAGGFRWERLVEWIAPYATAGYFAGLMAMMFRLLTALWGGHCLRASAAPIAEPALVDLVRRQARRIGLKGGPVVAWCGRVATPVVVGILKPAILLPASLASGLAPDQLAALVTHELAHIRRYDLAVNLLQRIIEAVLFFHPAVWYVSRQISRERENCCDDFVLGAGWPRTDYAEALLKTAELCSDGRLYASALGASVGHASDLKRRLLRLLAASEEPRVRLSRTGVISMTATMGLCIAMLLAWHRGVTAEAGPDIAALQFSAAAVVGGDAASTAASSPTAALPSVGPVQTLSGHTAAVRSVVFSPDGKTLASGGLDGIVRLWQVPPEGKERAALKVQPAQPKATGAIAVHALAFSPDGKLLASVGSDGLLRLWDPATGKSVRWISGHKPPVNCVAFSPDGKRVAVGDSNPAVRLWDVDSGKLVHGGFWHVAAVQGLAFGADGQTIVTTDGPLRIWQIDHPEEHAKIDNWTEVRSIARSPDDQAIAIGHGYDHAITLWTRNRDGELERYVLGGHQNGTNALAFSPDSKLLASAGSDGRIKLWDMETRRMLSEVAADRSAALAVAFSPDGRQLASAGDDHKVRFWNVDQLKALPQEKPRFPKVQEPPRPLRLRHAAEPAHVGQMKRLGALFLAKGARPTWSPDATRIAYVTVPDSELHILDLHTGQTRSLGAVGRDPAWSPKPGRWIAYTSRRQVAHFNGPSEPEPLQGDEEIWLIGSSGGQPRSIAEAFADVADAPRIARGRKIAEGFAPAWSADAKTLYFVSGKDQKVKSVEVKADGSPGAVKDLFKVSIRNLIAAISPGGRRVAYLGDGRLVVADREGDKTMPTWPTRLCDNWLLGWSPDGKILGGTTVWGCAGLVFMDQTTGRAVRLGTGEMFAPAWSPDGSMIAFDANLVDGCEIWMIEAKTLAALNQVHAPYRPKGPPARFDLAPPFPPQGKISYVDLQPKADQVMDLTTFDTVANDMRQVPQGEPILGGVKFTIGPGSLQLGSGLLPTAPERIEGIPVGKHVARIYVLHGTQFAGPAHNVADGTTIGWYRVVYEDQSEQSIAIVAGEDVRSWFVVNDPEPPTRGKKVWEGKNLLAQWWNTTVRLFASGWTNPHPEKKVARIDFLAAGTQAAPFCLAITIEEPQSGAVGTKAKSLEESSPAQREAYGKLLQQYRAAEAKRDNILRELKKSDTAFERASHWLEKEQPRGSTRFRQLQKEYLLANPDKKSKFRQWVAGYSALVSGETRDKEWRDVPSARPALLFLAEKVIEMDRQRARARKSATDGRNAETSDIPELKGSDAEKWNQFRAYSARRYGDAVIDFDVAALERDLQIPQELKNELRKEAGSLFVLYDTYYRFHLPPELAAIRRQMITFVNDLNRLRPGWETAEGIEVPATARKDSAK